MIKGLVMFAMVMLMLAWIVGSIELYFRDRTVPAAILFFGGLLIACLVFGYAMQERLDATPCVKWETTMQFNPAIKTMMPMRHCVQRGEWVTEEEGS